MKTRKTHTKIESTEHDNAKPKKQKLYRTGYSDKNKQQQIIPRFR